jgi:hypothetical protein
MGNTALNRAAIAFCLVLFVASAHAADIHAASCLRDDVQAAINAASTGDRVLVPAGNCTWTLGVTIDGKNIILQGAGKTQTVITQDFTGTAVSLRFTASRLTQFGFLMLQGARIVDSRGGGFRIDNNIFDNISGVGKVAVHVQGSAETGPVGLIDNNEFFECRTLILGDLSALAHGRWVEPSAIGTGNAVFIEDNVFNRSTGNAVDTNYGGRYVFRHNTILLKSYAEVHSLQGNHRATRSWEIYENTFHASTSLFTAMFLRGGTGVAFNNTITGSYGTPPMRMDNVRSFSRPTGPGGCDGTSPWDGNLGGAESPGWPCRDQIGRGRDEFLWTTATPFPPQTSEPAYFWGNTFQGNPINPGVVSCSNNTVVQGGPCAHIQLGRDFFLQPRPGYTPFPYPHPMRSEDFPPPPSPPAALQGTVRQ